ncbi:MAG: histidinol phosphate phosphatase domain-containing protein [Chloroflexi bacterium]|nr:histidinol phosphate phosphatase domain-containing protein [Chloroflexota bacterium]
MVYDLHTHSLLSDGELSPVELIRRAAINGYTAIALTDHVGLGYLGRIIEEAKRDCALAAEYWGITAIAGVELTHVPAKALGEAAREAKERGAQIVIVHGETIVEPVEPGTNLAAVQSPHVDILAHPGLMSPEEAKLAASNGVFLEISARKGHSLTNGHVVRMARLAGTKLLVNSDGHAPGDLLSDGSAQAVARGAGLDEAEVDQALLTSPRLLLAKLKIKGKRP